MATADSTLLSQLSQGSVLQIQQIINSKIDFEKLTDVQNVALSELTSVLGLPTTLAAFIIARQHPELFGLPPISLSETETAVVDTQTIAANVNLYLIDQEALEKINQEIETKLARENQVTKNRIKRLVALEISRRQAEILALRATPENDKALKQISSEVDSKNPPLPLIAALSTQYIEAVLPQLTAQQGLTITPAQKERAIQNLATIIIAGTATNSLDLTNPSHRDEAIEASLIDIPAFHSATADLYRQIEQIVIPISKPEYNSTDPTRLQVSPNILVTKLESLHLPTTAPVLTLAFPPDFEEKAETIHKVSQSYVAAVNANTQSSTIVADLTQAISPKERDQLITLAINNNLVTRTSPTKNGAAAEVIIHSINQPNNKAIDPSALRLYAMGFALKNAKEIIANDPNHPLSRYIHDNPNVTKQLEATYQQLDGSKLSQEIKPSPLSGLAARYQSFTNTISNFLPGRAGQIFNIVSHPIQFVQSKIGNFIGNRIVGQFKNWLAEKVATATINETLKQTASFILKEGVQKGVTLVLEKLGATALVASVSAALGISTGGVSLIIQAAVMAAMWIGEKTVGLVKNIANGLARSMTGEDFDWRTLAAAPLLLLGGAGGIIASLATAASVAAASAGVIILASSIVGFFLYISILAVAPIITTIAHLESGLGPQQGPASGAFPYQPYTGPILPGCSQIWPVSGGFIIQGPHGTYSHQTIEAVDIYTSIGSPVKSVSTGTVNFTGWGDAYGNMITINSTSQDGKEYVAVYAHLSEIGVSVGDPVGVGTIIALAGATSSVPGFANPHLHLEYRGLSYNACPAGGVQVPDGCYSAIIGTSNACLINGKPIYTN